MRFRILAFTTIHDLMFSLTEDVADPIIPYLEKVEDKIKISHVAILKKTK